MNKLKEFLLITASELKRNTGKYLDIVVNTRKPIYISRAGKIIAMIEVAETKDPLAIDADLEWKKARVLS